MDDLKLLIIHDRTFFLKFNFHAPSYIIIINSSF